MTQRQQALKGIITPAMEAVAFAEGFSPEEIRQRVASGEICIPCNLNHKNLRPCGIGKGLKTKVNANIGTSGENFILENELKKLDVCLEAGADAVMDLSTGGNLVEIREAIIKNCPVPVGTVPIYDVATRGSFTADDLFEAIENHAKAGVDFVTVHCGITLESISRLKKHPRVLNVVSRGGAILIDWIQKNKQENPLYAQYDRLLDLAREYDLTLSLGDGMRPGCIADATDRAQIQELIILGELTKRAWEAGVQVMIEGPGHVPLDQIEENVKLQKSICQGAPFYVLGPLPTDVGVGHDHITCAIGGALAASKGVDFICYVTPTEHLGLPNSDDVREGIIASRLAAHIGDIAKGVKKAKEWDREMAQARQKLDWKRQIELALDPKGAKAILHRVSPGCEADKKECSMCGTLCAIKLSNENL
jgi:phosphomethylpyrimidine synthase